MSNKNYKDNLKGIRVTTQVPLNVKEWVKDEVTLSNLGLNNNLAFTYHDNIKIFCFAEKTLYTWKEVEIGKENTGLLTVDFQYPANTIMFDIDYSNKRYNFFLTQYQLVEDVIDYNGANVGITGVGIFRNLTGTTTKILNFKKIKSNTLDIIDQGDEIGINIFNNNSIKTFYVNSNYIPTINNPSDGSLARPYVDYDEVKTAVIGTGNLYNPQYTGAVIILQTSSNTSNNPTVNTITIKSENNSSLIYTGTDPYMIDTEVIYPLIPKNSPRNDLTQDIYINLTGKLTITRTNGIGLVRGIGANRNGLGQTNDKYILIKIGENSDDEITLKERSQYPSSIYDGDVTFPDNSTYESVYGYPHKYTTQLSPTLPLIFTEYNSASPQTWAIQCYGKINIETVANTAIEIGNDTIFFADKVSFSINGKLISTTSGTKLIDRPYVYQPKPNRNFVQGKNRFYVKELIIEDSAGYLHIGVDNFFKFTDNGKFDFGIMNISSNMYVNKFFNINDISNTINYINISNELKGSNISLPQARYFIDSNQSSLNINMPHSNINGFSDKSVSPINLTGITFGTVSSFLGKLIISGIDNYSNDTAAAAAGLIQNSIYFNTTNNALDKL